MAFLLNFCAGILFLAGLGTAIGVPLSLSVNKDKDSTQLIRGGNTVSAGGGGIQQTSSYLEKMDKCSSTSDLKVINYGDSSVKEVCWEIHPEVAITQSLTNEDKYNDLFQKSGRKGTGSWVEGQSDWQSVHCSNKGMFSTSLTHTEHLGLCDKRNLDEKKGVLIEKKNTTEPQISICEGDCFNSTTQSGSMMSLNFNSRTGTGHKIQFKAKKR